MFFKKKIQPNVDSLIGFKNSKHWSEYYGQHERNYYRHKKEGRIVEVFYPFYSKGEMVGRRKINLDLRDSFLTHKE